MRKRKRGSLRERTTKQIKTRNESGGSYKPLLDFSNYEKVERFRPKFGKQNISILPYIVGKNHPELEEGSEDYKLDIHVHQGVGPNNDTVVCLKHTYGGACPVCEERDRLMDEENMEWDDEEPSALYPSRRCWYNVIDNNYPDKGIQIWEKVSFKNFEKRLLATAEEDYEEIVIFADLDEGANIHFKIIESSFPGKKGRTISFPNYENFSLDPRPAIDESIFDEVFPLDEMLIVNSYEEIDAIFRGKLEVEANDDKDQKEQAQFPRATAKVARESMNPDPDNKKSRELKKNQQEQEETNACEFGHVYGVDTNQHDDCDNCSEEEFDKCMDTRDSIEADESAAKSKKSSQAPKRKSKGFSRK